MSLESDLQEIDGVGDATAEKILDVVADYEDDSDGGTDERVGQALALLRRGRADLARAKLEEALGA